MGPWRDREPLVHWCHGATGGGLQGTRGLAPLPAGGWHVVQLEFPVCRADSLFTVLGFRFLPSHPVLPTLSPTTNPNRTPRRRRLPVLPGG